MYWAMDDLKIDPTVLVSLLYIIFTHISPLLGFRSRVVIDKLVPFLRRNQLKGANQLKIN
jgi:hypothetical protein